MPSPLVDESLLAPWPIERFAEIDSTNEEAKRRALSGEGGPLWLLADSQTAGRGRLGRSWSSPPGNLFATALFATRMPIAGAGLICFSAGLAVLDAVVAAGAPSGVLKLKWPNDVLVGEGLRDAGAKVAGVLIETLPGGDAGVVRLAAGFGVNLALAPDVPGRLAASIAGTTGLRCLPAAFLPLLDQAFRARLRRLTLEGFASTRLDWMAQAAHLGCHLEAVAGRVSGRMLGIDEAGALELQRLDGGIEKVHAGEISLAAQVG